MQYFKSLTINLLLICNLCSLFLIQIEEAAAETKAESKNKKSSELNNTIASGDSKDPVFIKSDTLNLNSKDRLFTYKGNVKVVRGEVEITTDLMIGQYSEKQELETVVCQGNVVVTRGAEMRATSNRAYYNIKSGKIELTQEPELTRGINVLAADKIIVYANEDKSEAEGNVRVKVVKDQEKGIQIPGKSKK